MKKFTPLALFLISLSCLSGPAARADSRDSLANVKDPCTDHEVWEYSPSVPKAWQDRFSTAVSGAKGPDFYLIIFASAKSLRDLSKDKAFQALGDYQMGRAFFRLGLPYLAYEKFNDVLMQDAPRASGLKVAALKCLSHIQSGAPSLVLMPSTLHAIASSSFLSGQDRAQFLDMLVSFSEKSPSSDIADAMNMLKGSGPYESYVLALQSAKAGNAAEAVVQGEKFLSYEKIGDGLPDSLKGRADEMRVLLGQLDYDARKYGDAAVAFRGVSSDSNDLSQALTDLAWSDLLGKRYADAMGAARNLLMGGLKRTFSPEANLVSAIAFLETCHYTEALKSVKMFQKSYWYSYNWLYQWHKSRHAGESPYRRLAKYIDKKEKLPVRVASEWERSPIFIQSQEELNVIYDERDAMKPLLPEAMRFKRTHHRLAPALNSFIASLHQEVRTNQSREKSLLSAINSDLTQRGEAMLVNIADVWGNSQLLEVDTYNQIGDKMMADNFSAKYRKMTKNRKVHKDDAPVWDWGRVPATDQDSEEVWEDEVGFLQVDLNDQCVKPKM